MGMTTEGLPLAVGLAMRAVVEYAWEKERADWEEQDEDGQRTHVWNDLEVLRRYVATLDIPDLTPAPAPKPVGPKRCELGSHEGTPPLAAGEFAWEWTERTFEYDDTGRLRAVIGPKRTAQGFLCVDCGVDKYREMTGGEVREGRFYGSELHQVTSAHRARLLREMKRN